MQGIGSLCLHMINIACMPWQKEFDLKFLVRPYPSAQYSFQDSAIHFASPIKKTHVDWSPHLLEHPWPALKLLMWILFQLKRMELRVMTWRHRLNATILDINSDSDGDVRICWDMFPVFCTLRLEATSHMFHPSWLYQSDVSLWLSCILSTWPSQSVAGVCVFNPVIATAPVLHGFNSLHSFTFAENGYLMIYDDICRHSKLPQHL